MYLDKFSNEDFVNLINLCNNPQRDLDVVDLALVADEESRRSLKGERYFWIRGVKRGSVPKLMGEFIVNDFGMSSSDGTKDYSGILKMYMVQKFGVDYINDVYNQRLAEASLETEQLFAYLKRGNEDEISRS